MEMDAITRYLKENWATVSPVIVMFATGFWVLYQEIDKRRNRRVAETTSASDKFALELKNQGEFVSRAQAQLFERMQAELVRIDKSRREIEEDRDRGWDLARFWFKFTRRLFHARNNGRAVVDAYVEQVRKRPQDVDSIPMPSFEEIEVPSDLDVSPEEMAKYQQRTRI